MSSAINALIPQLANYNPAGFALGNQRLQGEIGLNAAQAANLQGRTQLEAQQTQGAALQNQLTQIQINDQKAIGRAWAGWDADKDPSGQGLLQAAIKNGATPASVMGVQQHLASYNASLATADKTRLENGQMRADAFAGKIQAIIEAPAEQQDALIAQYKNDLLALDPSARIPDHFGLNEFKGLQKFHQYQSKQIEQQLKAQQTATSAAQEKEATAKATHQETINQLIKTGNQAAQNGQNPIDAIFPAELDQATHNSYAAAWQAAGQQPPDENGRRPAQDSILSAAASHAAEYRKATSPTIRAGEVAKATDIARAEAPIRTAQAVETETQTAPIRLHNAIEQAKALRVGDNPAVAKVPPQLVQGAVNAAQKLDEQYIKAAEATESMGKLLDLADQQNVAAGANIPMVGVGAANAVNGIRRINSAEIAQYGTAGSLLQKIQGKLQGWTEGQPIPASVRDDIRELHQQLGESAYKAYTEGLGSLNSRTQSDFGPTVPAPNIRKGAASRGGMPRVATPADVAKLPKGTHFLDPNGIERIAR